MIIQELFTGVDWSIITVLIAVLGTLVLIVQLLAVVLCALGYDYEQGVCCLDYLQSGVFKNPENSHSHVLFISPVA